LLYASRDYVIVGFLERPYGEDDGPNPFSVHGQSKLWGGEHLQSLYSKVSHWFDQCDSKRSDRFPVPRKGSTLSSRR